LIDCPALPVREGRALNQGLGHVAAIQTLAPLLSSMAGFSGTADIADAPVRCRRSTSADEVAD
jgi:hypothetical protein